MTQHISVDGEAFDDGDAPAGSSFGAGIDGASGSSSGVTSKGSAAGGTRKKKAARKASKRTRKTEATDPEDEPREQPAEDRGAEGDGAPARRPRRRRKAAASAAETADDGAAAGDRDAERGDGDSSRKKKSRRRGTRGGKRRKRQDDDAAEIDAIPGEDDDLMDDRGPRSAAEDEDGSGEGGADEDGPHKRRSRKRTRRRGSRGAADADADADGPEADDDDAPDEGKSSGRGRKKAARKKKARAPQKTAEEKAAEAEALRTLTIAVNAVEPEERRVAVFEGDRIIDFLMNAESQKTLVNDIYRGRVVNLEPAIGAAFIDFGQGRNGFLHTSDVLPIYGEKDFKLEDLLSGGIHDEEGDHDADWSEEADALDEDDEDADADDAEASTDDASGDDDDQGDDDEGDADEDDGKASGRRVVRSRRRPPSPYEVMPPDDGDGEAGGGDDGDGGGRKKRSRSRTRRKKAGSDDARADDGGAEETSRSKKKRSAKAASKKTSAKKASSKKKAAKKSSSKKGSSKTSGSSKKKGSGSKKGGAKKGGGRSRRGGGRGERRPQRERRPIDQLLKVGDPVVVQVTKDAIGDKGPTLTTYISMPGRYLVLMPSMSRTGVSRKIPDEKERKRLKRILTGLNTPDDMGVIVRTAGVGRTKADLKRDRDYLFGLWEAFGKKLRGSRGPAPLYLESDVATRTLRDLFNRRTKEVLVDDFSVYEQMVTFAEELMPEHVGRIKRHEGDRPLFQHCGIEQDFERIFARRVDLPSGGSIVFDQAEALVAIDVNSGRTRTDSYDFEEIALKTNLEAVPEIARQIKLRDLGGIIVCDFIDMMRSSSNKQVERALKEALSDDRARSKLGRISQFGLLELTRQRLGPGTHKKVFGICPRCRGTGQIRTVQSRAQAILRRLGGAVVQKGFSRVEVRAHPEVVDYLKEELWDWVRAMEHRSEKEIVLTSVPEQAEDSVLRYLRADGREVRPGGRRKR